MSPFRLIVFDLDGTLVDSRRDIADAANALLISCGAAPIPETDIGRMVGDGAATLVARAFKASRAQIFWKIEFPASLPPLFAGLRIGSTLAVVGVVVGELVGGNMGLGYLLSFGEGQANTAMVFVAIVMLTLVGGIAYLLVILIEQRVLHYLPKRAQMGF